MKFLKRFIPLLLSVCFIAGVSFAGCKKDPEHNNGDPPVVENPAENGYTFTVKYPDGAAVNGITDASGRNTTVYIMLSDAQGNFMDNDLSMSLFEKDSANVNASGIAKFKCAPGEYGIVIENVPYGYHVGEYKTDTTHENYEITLTHNKVTYTANITDENGNAASGVTVDMKNGDDVMHTVTTDASGKATFPETNSGIYSVTAHTDAYTSKSYITEMRDAEELTNDVDIDITLVPYTMLALADSEKLTDEQTDVMTDAFNSSLLTLFNESLDSFIYEADVAEGKETFFAFTPRFTAAYSLYIYGGDKRSVPYTITIYGDSIDNTDTMNIQNGIGTGLLNMYCTAGVPYFFSCARTSGAGRYSFVISNPDFTKEEYPTYEPGTYEQTYYSNNQLLAFKPSVSGIYEFTTDSTQYDTYIENLGYANNVIGSDDDGGEGKNFRYVLEVRDSEVGNKYTFRIKLKNIDGSEISIPAKFNVIITRTGNATPETPIETRVVNATATEKCTEQGASFVWLPLNGTVRPHKGNDGFWYVTVNGKEKKVFVALSKDISARDGYKGEDSDLSFATIEYKGSGTVTPGEDDDDNNTRKNNYLTVFEDLANSNTCARLSYTSFIEHYTGYKNGKPVAGAGICNSDGMYALNEELHTFLTLYFAVAEREGEPNLYRPQGHSLVSMFADNPNQVLDNGCGWYVACGYYE